MRLPSLPHRRKTGIQCFAQEIIHRIQEFTHNRPPILLGTIELDAAERRKNN